MIRDDPLRNFFIAQSRCEALRSLMAKAVEILRSGSELEKALVVAVADIEGIQRELDIASAELERAAAALEPGDKHGRLLRDNL